MVTALAAALSSAPATAAAQPDAPSPASQNSFPRGLPDSSTLAEESRTARLIPGIVQKWKAAWEASDGEAMAKLFTPDGVYDDYAFQVRSRGSATIVEWVKSTGRSLPGAKSDILDVVQSRDRIVYRWMFDATPAKTGGLPANRRSFSAPAVSVLDMKGGLIRRNSDDDNLADLLRQLGLPAGAWTTAATIGVEQPFNHRWIRSKT
jgi:steroid delta-isomerase-like uncharacterized protein